MIKNVVYPGSFDPMTNGHLDIIKRSLNIFDRMTIVLAKNSLKTTFFSLSERIEMIKETLDYAGLSEKVTIDNHDGLLVDYCRKNDINILIRGIRPLVDFEYEFEMAMINRELNHNIETLFILTDQEYFYLRSTLIKDVVRLGGDISSKVPPPVLEALKRKLLDKA